MDFDINRIAACINADDLRRPSIGIASRMVIAGVGRCPAEVQV
jgi:hypothetical protein